MSMAPCVASVEAIGYENSNSLQLPEALEEHAQMVTAASTVALNGPISILLEELLVMIFDDVVMSESSSCQYQRTVAGWWISSPRNLAGVSRGWRTVVFACPKLWRHVHLMPIQPVHALKEQLRLSSPLPIHLIVHQWPFRHPISGSGPFSVVGLTAQLQSILSPSDKEEITLAPASQRVESITINATECSMFLNFVLQTCTGRGSKFPALRHVAMNGNVCATWSRACFFDGRNAPRLEQLELSNVVIAQHGYRLPWGIGLNLTTLVWAAPVLKHGSLVVSVSCFHHVVSSFPNLTTLKLRGHVVALEFATLESLVESEMVPLTHIRDLDISGRAFSNARGAFFLFYLLPSVRRIAIRGRACSGPFDLRTVTHAMQALMCLPLMCDLSDALPHLETLELDCVEDACEGWKTWFMEKFEQWRQWRETRAGDGAARMRVHVNQVDEDEEDLD